MSNEKENNLRQCKICLQTKQRILAGKYPDNRNSRWVDDCDRQWNGRVCPECNVTRARNTMKRAREVVSDTSS